MLPGAHKDSVTNLHDRNASDVGTRVSKKIQRLKMLDSIFTAFCGTPFLKFAYVVAVKEHLYQLFLCSCFCSPV